MTNAKNKVEFKINDEGLEIKINGFLHLHASDVNAIHSYIDEKPNPKYPTEVSASRYYNLYYIEFHLDNSVVKCVYNDRELWETILKGLE